MSPVSMLLNGYKARFRYLPHMLFYSKENRLVNLWLGNIFLQSTEEICFYRCSILT